MRESPSGMPAIWRTVLLVLGLWSTALRAAEPSRPSGPRAGVDQTFVVNTEIGTYALFHPDDLGHHLTDPLRWPWYEFSVRSDFEAGRLVCFENAFDGGFKFRVTTGPLTAREKRWKHSSWVFRYEVKHGRIFLDSAEALPHGEKPEALPPDSDRRWISIPNGKYRVTVSDIDWHKEPGALDENDNATDKALPSFVIRFEPVADLKSVPFKTTMPKFDFATGTPTAALLSGSRGKVLDELPQFVPQQKVAVLVDERVRLFPRQKAQLRVPVDVARPLLDTERNDGSMPGSVIVIPTKDSRSGVLASMSDLLESRRGESVELAFAGYAVVRLKSVTQVGPRRLAEVEHLMRPKGELSAREVAELKAAFLAFSKRDAAYRQQTPFPDFEAQTFLEMDSLEGMSHFLVSHVPVPAATQWELLTLSNEDRLRRLRPLLEAPGAPAEGAARDAHP